MTDKSKWKIFRESKEYQRLRAVLPKGMYVDVGSMSLLSLQDDAINLYHEERKLRVMIDHHKEWLRSPNASYWTMRLKTNLGPDSKEAQKESQALLDKQRSIVAKLRQKLTSNPYPEPETLLTDSYLVFPLEWLGLSLFPKNIKFVPKTPQQVYAIYRIRSFYAKCQQEETDDPIDKLCWGELVRRLEIAHDIYKNIIGSEKPY